MRKYYRNNKIFKRAAALGSAAVLGLSCLMMAGCGKGNIETDRETTSEAVYTETISEANSSIESAAQPLPSAVCDIGGRGIFYSKDGLLMVSGTEPGTQTEIGDSVAFYVLTKDNRLIYTTEDGTMYTCTGDGVRTMIQENVDYFHISEDGTKASWIEKDGKMYIKDLISDTSKIYVDSGVDSLGEVSDDMNAVLYYAREEACVIKDREEIIRLGGQYTNVFDVNGDFRVICFEEDKLDMPAGDIVEDDIKDDKNGDYVNIRESLKQVPERSFGFAGGNFVMHNIRQGKSDILTENVYSVTSYEYNNVFDKYNLMSRDCVTILEYVPQDELVKLKLSEIAKDSTETDVTDRINQYVLEEMKYYFLYNDQVTEWNTDGRTLYSYQVDYGNSKVYASFVNEGEELKETLVSFGFSAGVPGQLQEIAADLFGYPTVVNGNVYSIKNSGESAVGDLYCNDTRIDTLSSYTAQPGEGDLFYYRKDADLDGLSDLYAYDGTGSAMIAEKVWTECYLDGGLIAIYTDFNGDKRIGSLKLYDGNKIVELDTGVDDVYFERDTTY